MGTELGKYMYAVKVFGGTKTSRWNVFNKRSDDRMGTIAWYGPCRQYVFEPDIGTVFNSSCLGELESFLRECNFKHKESRAKENS